MGAVTKKKPTAKKVKSKKTLIPAKTKKVVAKTKKLVRAKNKLVADNTKSAIELLFPKKVATAIPQPVNKKEKKKVKKKVYALKKPFDAYCAMAIMEKILSQKKNELSSGIKDDAFKIFYSMLDKGLHHDSFVGKYQDKKYAEATALFTLKRKGAISEELAQTLIKYGIDFDRTVSDTPACEDSYILNPELFHADQTILKKIADALSNVEGIDLSSVFIQTTAESCTQPTIINDINDNTIPSIVKKVTNEKERLDLLDQVTQLQISSAKLGGDAWNTETAKEVALAILKDLGIV